jgi:ribose 5-phosphate isomerase A
LNGPELQRAAALAALAELPESGVIGLGTGSTVAFFIDALAELVRHGRFYTGVATSQRSRAQAIAGGIAVLDDDGPWQIDVTVDGADEVDPSLRLIKGGGGAHTREKIVNASSSRNVIVVDESKLSSRLGERRPIPVEVLRFGHGSTARALAAFGRVTLREGVTTDAGNPIYDVERGPIDDVTGLDAALRSLPGVVETGLFWGTIDVVYVAGAGGVRRLVPDGALR